MEQLKAQIKHVLDTLQPQFRIHAKRKNRKADILKAKIQTLKDVLMLIRELEGEEPSAVDELIQHLK